MSTLSFDDRQESCITFLSRGSGGNLLQRMRPDGSEVATVFGGELEDVPGLSEGQVLYRDPHWTRQSPDRRFFLSWAHDRSPSSEKCPGSLSVFMIYLGRVDGGLSRVLAPVRPGEVFTWAPDSRKFAYSRFNGPDTRTVTGLAPRLPSTQVVVAEIDGTAEEVVLEKPGYWTASDWSADGNRLLLIYDPTRSPCFGRSDLIELDLDMARHQKERMRELQPAEDFASGRTIDYCLKSLTDGLPIGWFVDSRYSPDGKTIAVVYSHRARLVDFGFHKLGLFDITSETIEPIAEVPNPEVISGPICWSPDGTEILFARRVHPDAYGEVPAASESRLPSIWAIRPDGTGARFITEGWSPDWR
jgi:hypothetical protein